MARSIQRDREQESAQRAEQYVRAVRIFYLKFKRYPTSIEQLEKTNNQRFLRQRYIDPLTGKSDWRLIHVGENQTTVKGFFGDDLPGLPGMSGGGLGSASAMASGSTSTSAFNNSGLGGTGTGAGTSPLGGSTTPGGGSTSAFGSSGTSSTGAGTGTTSSNGISSQDATSFTGSGGGQIIGVGSAKSGEAMLVVNEQTSYETWEFLYDPRIEQLYAKGTLLGGIASGTGTSSSGGLGSAQGMASPGLGGTPTNGTGTGTTTPPTTGSPVGP
jgi:hypothetical protein